MSRGMCGWTGGACESLGVSVCASCDGRGGGGRPPGGVLGRVSALEGR